MKDRILETLNELVRLKSRTGTEDENLASEYIYNYICDLDYFKKNKELCGLVPVKDDPIGRNIPYGLILGHSRSTVILSGHFDVVDEFDYGDAKQLAYTPGIELENMLKKNPMTAEQREDMESGDWIWGKGVADMKGGLAIHLELFSDYSDKALNDELEGSILFIGVPDEESYSYGMRAASAVISELAAKYSLDYKLLINPEPTDYVGGKQIMSLGSVGKIMPVVMAQGISSHIGHVFNGFNPLDILTGIYKRTNGNLDFSDTYEEEATMPPTWLKLRDLKDVYDVSIPLRAAGYFTVLSLSSAPDEIMEKIRNICVDVCKNENENWENIYSEYKKRDKFETREKLDFKPEVYTFSHLRAELSERYGDKFEKYYEASYENISRKLSDGTLNYPDATIELMSAVMDFANFTDPVVLVAFAPPYYPAVNGNLVKGKEGFNMKAYNIISKLSAEFDNTKVDYKNYFIGISDNSYSAVTGNLNGIKKYAEETPLWGKLYSIDFDSIAQINVPAIIYGPLGREFHKWSERVNKKSLLNTVPYVTRKLIEQAWDF